MKMSDVFKFPVRLDVKWTCIRDAEERDVACFNQDEQGENEAKAICDAINSHDKLTERVKVLEAALKSIEDKANKGITILNGGGDNYDSAIDILYLTEEALKAGE